MLRPYLLILAAALSLAAAEANADGLCEAVALRDVGALEDPTSMIARGSTLDGITQYSVEKQTGIKKFCQHGGYCYPTEVTIDGKKVATFKLTTCQIGHDVTDVGDELIYGLDVLRDKVPAEALRREDVAKKLFEMGLNGTAAP